jgi:methionyl-tRNA formyltransferase
LLEVIQNLERGVISRVKQDDSQATYAHMLKREDEWIDWTRTAQEICNQIRGLSPAPGAYTLLDGIKLKIFAARLTDERCSGLAGQIVALSKKGFVVKTGEQCLEILEVQKEGKKRSKAVDFVRGYRDLEGRVLGQKGG